MKEVYRHNENTVRELPVRDAEEIIRTYGRFFEGLPGVTDGRAGELTFVYNERWNKPIIEWRERGFSLYDYIENTKGLILEVGGPTIDDVGVNKLWLDSSTIKGKNTIISNITPEAGVDLVADGRNLHFDDNSVSMEFAASLGARGMDKHQLRKEVFTEAWRILEPGGLLVYEHGQLADIANACQLGFDIMQWKFEYDHDLKKYATDTEAMADPLFDRSYSFIAKKVENKETV